MGQTRPGGRDAPENASVSTRIACQACPRSAVCLGGDDVRPAENRWGFVAGTDPPSLQFAVCPAGYVPFYY